MEFEDKIKNKLLMRGFPNEKLLNNRGLIGATIDEVILMTVKKLAIPDVSQQRELLLAYEEFTSYKVLGKKTERISKQMVEDYLANNCA